MIKCTSISLTLVDKSVMHGLCWQSDVEDKELKGNVIILTGMEEHSSRYNDFAAFLVNNHYNVYCIDHFGQGQNVLPDMSNRGIWPTSGFRKMVVATDALVAKLRASLLPIYIFSHSMGSFMAQEYMQRYSGHVSKVVLCGSGSKNNMAGLGFRLAKLVVTKGNRNNDAKILKKLMFGGFNKRIENPRTEYDWLSISEENVDKYIADPLCGGPTKNCLCYELLKGLKRLYRPKFLKRLDPSVNILIISGSLDPVTNYGQSVETLKAMYNKYGVSNVKGKVYEGFRHEILNEDIKEDVYNDILDFFNE